MNSPSDMAVRAIAFYLPQFHPIPENDQWWGQGFTEWTNVVRAKPLFRGHGQPHLPADLGYYDLRVPEVRQEQALLAHRYGIHGFCYYHYWFNSRRVLGRPFTEVHESGKPDFPFCLCWANENWTRVWDGSEQDILLEQRYSEADDYEHIRWLCRVFADPRYIRVAGRPLFLIYRMSRLPDPQRTASIWREEADRLGIGEIFLCYVQSFSTEHRDPAEFGCDAAVEFQPDWSNIWSPVPSRGFHHWIEGLRRASVTSNGGYIHEYDSVVERMLSKPLPDYLRFPGVTPMWDNTARRKQSPIILHGSTPKAYERWLRGAIERYLPQQEGHDLVFINAWNEWGEGSHLEPCRRFGHAYLEATHRALAAATEQQRRRGQHSREAPALSPAGCEAPAPANCQDR